MKNTRFNCVLCKVIKKCISQCFKGRKKNQLSFIAERTIQQAFVLPGWCLFLKLLPNISVMFTRVVQADDDLLKPVWTSPTTKALKLREREPVIRFKWLHSMLITDCSWTHGMMRRGSRVPTGQSARRKTIQYNCYITPAKMIQSKKGPVALCKSKRDEHWSAPYRVVTRMLWRGPFCHTSALGASKDILLRAETGL